MISLEEVRQRLRDHNLSKVAEGAGVHRNAIYRLVSEGSNPSYITVQKIIKYLEQTQNQ